MCTFQVKINLKVYLNLLGLLLFCNVHHSKLRDNLRVDLGLLLGRIVVSSVVLLSATVRSLKT